MTVAVVSLERSQAEAVAALRARFWRDQVEKGALEAAPACTADAVQDLAARARTHVLVALRGDEAIGYLLGQTKVQPGAEPVRISSVEEVFVSEDERRGAAASLLVKAALERFRADQADRIQLRVLARNEGGAGFWRAIGFTPYVTTYELGL